MWGRILSHKLSLAEGILSAHLVGIVRLGFATLVGGLSSVLSVLPLGKTR
jgi:hypothetical protein